MVTILERRSRVSEAIEMCPSRSMRLTSPARFCRLTIKYLASSPMPMPASRLVAGQRAEHRPLLRRQPLRFDRPAAGLMQHIGALIEPKEQPVGQFHLGCVLAAREFGFLSEFFMGNHLVSDRIL